MLSKVEETEIKIKVLIPTICWRERRSIPRITPIRKLKRILNIHSNVKFEFKISAKFIKVPPANVNST